MADAKTPLQKSASGAVRAAGATRHTQASAPLAAVQRRVISLENFRGHFTPFLQFFEGGCKSPAICDSRSPSLDGASAPVARPLANARLRPRPCSPRLEPPDSLDLAARLFCGTKFTGQWLSGLAYSQSTSHQPARAGSPEISSDAANSTRRGLESLETWGRLSRCPSSLPRENCHRGRQFRTDCVFSATREEGRDPTRQGPKYSFWLSLD